MVLKTKNILQKTYCYFASRELDSAVKRYTSETRVSCRTKPSALSMLCLLFLATLGPKKLILITYGESFLHIRMSQQELV
jgi:hypothetical protein